MLYFDLVGVDLKKPLDFRGRRADTIYMSKIVYQDARVTEYADGTEEVSFSEDEHAFMAANPRYFELVLRCGHSRSFYNYCEGCNACLDIMESADPEATAAGYAVAPKDRDFPA